MNGCYKYNKLLWNFILYYEYGMDSCMSYAEADGCTLDILSTHPIGILRWRQSKMTVKKEDGISTVRYPIDVCDYSQ